MPTRSSACYLLSPKDGDPVINRMGNIMGDIKGIDGLASNLIGNLTIASLFAGWSTWCLADWPVDHLAWPFIRECIVTYAEQQAVSHPPHKNISEAR
jgi:hypothetical protein